MSNCDHELGFKAHGDRFLDSNVIMLALKFRCAKCGQRFRILGVDVGVSADGPGCVGDGELAMLPLVPLDEEPQTVRIGRC